MSKSSIIKVTVLGTADNLKKMFGEAEQASKSFNDKMTDGSKKLAKGMAIGGLAAGAALTKGFFDALDANGLNAKLAAKLNLTADEADKAGKIAGNVYGQGWGDSLETVNAAIAGVQSHLADLGNTSQADFEKITSGALSIAEVFDQDVNEVTRTAGLLMKNGLAKNATEAMDLITRGFQTSGDASGEFLDTLNEYSTHFSSLGIDGATAIGLVNKGMESGSYNADKLGDAIKEFSVRAIDGGQATADAFSALGLNADEMAQKLANGGPAAKEATSTIIKALSGMSDKVKQDAVGVALFGSMWEDLGPDVVASLDPMAASLDDVSGATDKLGKSLEDDLGRKIEKLKRQGFQKLAEIANTYVVPAVEKIASFVGNTLVPALVKLADWLGENQHVLIGLGVGIAATLVPAFIAWATSAIAAAAATFLAIAPILLIGAAIAALVAGVIWAYQNWDFFRNAVDAVARFFTEKLWPALQAVAGWITGTLVPTIGKIMGKFGEWLGKAREVASGIKGKFDELVSFVTSLPGKISRAASGMWNGITSAFKSAINAIIRGWNSIEFKIPGFKVGPVGYDGFTLGLPDIPQLAKGGTATAAGTALVGEKGPELLHLPKGASVIPLNRAGGSSIVVNLYGSKATPEELVSALREYERRNGRRAR